MIGWADVSACTHVCSYVNWRYIVSGHRDEAAGGYTLFSVSPSESFSLEWPQDFQLEPSAASGILWGDQEETQCFRAKAFQ